MGLHHGLAAVRVPLDGPTALLALAFASKFLQLFVLLPHVVEGLLVAAFVRVELGRLLPVGTFDVLVGALATVKAEEVVVLGAAKGIPLLLACLQFGASLADLVGHEREQPGELLVRDPVKPIRQGLGVAMELELN